MQDLGRKFPVRVSMVAVNVLLYVFTVYAVSRWDAPAAETFEGLVAMCGVIGISVLGDTWRPSGKTKLPEADA